MSRARGLIGLKQVENLAVEAEFYCRVNASRKTMRLRELADTLQVDLTTLSKYINMHIKPSKPRMREINEKLKGVDYKSVVEDCLVKQPYPFPEMNNLTFKCPELLDCAVYEFLESLGRQPFDYILTIEGGGLALAQAIAVRIKSPLVYGLRDIIIRGGHSIPYKYTPVYAWGPRIKRYITFPLGGELRGKRVVVVDDIAWTGATVMTLIDYASRKKCEVPGVFLLATFRDVYDKIIEKSGTRVHAFLFLPDEVRKTIAGEFEAI
ncbi:MAG: hypothetical protein JHC12_00730 [Thermogladius sp.]|nr:hypothetical protein [Thermogladius sp.]